MSSSNKRLELVILLQNKFLPSARGHRNLADAGAASALSVFDRYAEVMTPPEDPHPENILLISSRSASRSRR
jgi:hypothetical protein